MSVPSELLMNTQNSFHTHAQRGANIVMRGGKRKSKRTKRMARKSRRRSRSRKQQKGGRGRTITYANLDFMANNGLGKMVPHGDAYTNCSKTQTGGGFGFTSQGAADAATFKGSYPAYQKYEKSKQCGGKRRHRRKSRKSKRKSRRKSRKSRRKRRKSRRRRRRRGGQKGGCGCKSKSLLMTQKGGSSHTYGAPFAGGDKPWATAPLGISKNPQSCYDNYNHFKGL